MCVAGPPENDTLSSRVRPSIINQMVEDIEEQRRRQNSSDDIEERRRQQQALEQEDFAWSDGARTSVASQMCALMLFWTVYRVSILLRPVALGLLLFYVSLTSHASRNRRSLVAPAQVVLATTIMSVFTSSLATSERAWGFVSLTAYCVEILAWRSATSDLVSLAFGKFQRQLFGTILVSTLWSVPALYDAAESLEADATGPAATNYSSLPADELQRQFAQFLLYAGTFLLVSFSIVAWARIYRVAPDLFRLLVAVAITGATVGTALRFLAGADDASMLAASSAAAFVAMAYCVLPAHDRQAAHLLHALAVALYLLSSLSRPTFALVCLFVQVLLKVLFIFHLIGLGNRRPTYLPRLNFFLNLLFPAAPPTS